VPALTLAGIPPFSGFLGKVGLLQAGVADGGPLAWTLVAGGLVTSLLTLYAVARVWDRVFWRAPHVEMPGPDDTTHTVRARAGREPYSDIAGHAGTMLPRLMVGPTVALTVVSVALTAVAGPLFELSGTAAADLLGRVPYVQAVYPEGRHDDRPITQLTLPMLLADGGAADDRSAVPMRGAAAPGYRTGRGRGTRRRSHLSRYTLIRRYTPIPGAP